MADQPDASELLRVAREALLKEVLPHLGEAHRYPALMIANAMGIAGREISDGGAGELETAQLLARLYDTDIAVANSPAPRQTDALALRLAADIRAGRYDGQAASLRAALLEQVRARLRISNPKYLAMAEQESGTPGADENWAGIAGQ